MSDTHDHPTKPVLGKDLNETHVLIGESGGMSAVYEVEPSNLVLGCLVVTTEHGPLYLDPDESYEVYDPDGSSDEPRLIDHVRRAWTPDPEPDEAEPRGLPYRAATRCSACGHFPGIVEQCAACG